MSQAFYQQGYDAFIGKQVFTDEQLKHQHTLFRTGYRAAQADAMKKNNVIFPTQLYDIPKRPEVFKPEWQDIMAATKRPRFKKLHTTEGKWVLSAIMKSVEARCDEVVRYKDVLRLVDEAFDRVLQYGFDEGVLSTEDCQQYNYTPISSK